MQQQVDFDEHSDPDSEPEIEFQTPRPRTKTHPKLVDSNSRAKYIARILETSVQVEKSIDEKLEQERVAWEFYGPARMRILKEIRREKYHRLHELLVIDRRKHKSSEWKK